MEIPECRHCQRRMHIHSHHLVSLRTMPVGNHTVCWWNVHYRRFICPECGRTEYDSIPFHYVGDGTSGAKVTVEFARYVWRRLDGSNIRSVADSLRLRWGTVKSIELFYMRQVLSMAGIPKDTQFLGIDELHIGHNRRKHHYITIISSLDHRRPIWVCDGKSIEDVMPFFSWYGKELLSKVKAISMDANAGYATAFRCGCPNACPVLDHFHIIQDYGRDCLGRIRIRLWHDLEETDRRLSRKFKNSQRTSLMREEDLSEGGLRHLQELRAASRDFDCGIVCLYLLRQVYEKHGGTRDEMKKAWGHWVAVALATGVSEIVTFARNKNTPASRDAILNYADFKVSNGPVEGINNKVGKVTQSAYGIRDLDYLFTKILFIFLPEKMRNFERDWNGDAVKKPYRRNLLDDTACGDSF